MYYSEHVAPPPNDSSNCIEFKGLMPAQRIMGNALGRCNDEFKAPTLLLRAQGLRGL